MTTHLTLDLVLTIAFSTQSLNINIVFSNHTEPGDEKRSYMMLHVTILAIIVFS